MHANITRLVDTFCFNFDTYAHACDPHQPVTIGFITRETAGVYKENEL